MEALRAERPRVRPHELGRSTTERRGEAPAAIEAPRHLARALGRGKARRAPPRGPLHAEVHLVDAAAYASAGDATLLLGRAAGAAASRTARVRLRRAARIGLHVAHRLHAAPTLREVLLVLLGEAGRGGRVAGLAADAEVLHVDPARAGGLVEVVVAVPGVGLALRDALAHRAPPVVGLEVEALVRRRRHARRLFREEVDDAELVDVLVRLVELH